MKAFKKLAAIVLAGVMALAVLTGCSSNDKDTFQKKLNEALDKAGIFQKSFDFYSFFLFLSVCDLNNTFISNLLFLLELPLYGYIF